MINVELGKLLDRIAPEAIDVGGYQIDSAIATVLVQRAIDRCKKLAYSYANGFLNITLEDLISKLNASMYAVFENESNATYICEDTILTSSKESDEDDGRYTFGILTYNQDTYNSFTKLCEEHLSETQLNTVFTLSHSSAGFYLSSLGKLKSPLIRDNYTEDVVEGLDFVISDFESPDPHGRLAIINGPPGTGKTYLIKGLVSVLQSSTMIIIPPRLISEIDGPSLLPTFIEHRRRNKSSIVLIIEDADACLAPRQSDNISSIASLLNCADGILGSMLDLKIIATTNQDRMEFDAALTRPGRLSRHIEVNSLYPERATQVYNRLVKDSLPEDDGKFVYKEPQTLAQVYIDADNATGGKIKGTKRRKKAPSIKIIKDKGHIGFTR